MLSVTIATAVLSLILSFLIGGMVGGYVVERQQRRLLLQLNAQWLLVSVTQQEPSVLLDSTEGKDSN